MPRCGNCMALNASKTCSGCNTISYCNRECQLAHWRTHKKHCRCGVCGGKKELQLRDSIQQCSNCRKFVPDCPPPKAATNEDCAICLEPLDKTVITLGCLHGYHAECFRKFAEANGQTTTCPMCRGHATAAPGNTLTPAATRVLTQTAMLMRRMGVLGIDEGSVTEGVLRSQKITVFLAGVSQQLNGHGTSRTADEEAAGVEAAMQRLLSPCNEVLLLALVRATWIEIANERPLPDNSSQAWILVKNPVVWIWAAQELFSECKELAVHAAWAQYKLRVALPGTVICSMADDPSAHN